MAAKLSRRFVWPKAADADLEAWKVRARALGIDITAPQFGGAAVESDSAAVREALKHATGCRCMEADAKEAAADLVNPFLDLRRAAKLTQEQAAAALGIKRSTVATYERNPQHVTRETLERARKAFGKGARRA